MKVLITGATGFLGSHLSKALLDNGHQVVILKRTRSSTTRIQPILPQISSYNLDQVDLNSIFNKENIDTVIHTATNYGKEGSSLTDVLDANIFFPLQLLESAILHRVPSWINTDTSLPPNCSEYALSKHQFVAWGKMFAEQKKIHFLNARLEHLIGPGDNENTFPSFITRSCLNNTKELKLTVGEQKRDFIHILDAVNVFLYLLNFEPKDAFFHEFDVGSGECITIKEFVQSIHFQSGSLTKLSFGSVPYRRNELMESCPNLDKLKALGWQAVYTLEESIHQIIQDFRSR